MTQPTTAMTKREMLEPNALTVARERGVVSGDVSMSPTRGGARFENMLQVMEFAKLMSLADVAVPKHFRANPGACLRVIMQADEWGFSPFAVADKTYIVGDKLAYESQLIHSVVERHAPLEGRLRHRFEGEADARVCIVTGRMIGEPEPFEWRSPPIGKINPKNSPEWKNNPDKQLYYHTSRDWARVYVPDVLLGVYTRDELDNTNFGPARAREVEGGVMSRLSHAATPAEFSPDTVAESLGADTGHVATDFDDATSPEYEAREAKVEADRAAAKAKPKTTRKKATAADAVDSPMTAPEYVLATRAWIEDGTNAGELVKRFDGERDMRDRLSVSIKDRNALQAALDDRVAVLKG
jgi:hypothetical protein